MPTYQLNPAQGLRDSTYSPTNPVNEASIRDQIQDIIDQPVAFANDVSDRLETHKTSSDHDGRYYTESELLSETDGSSGADKIGITSIPSLPGNKIQSVLESVKARFDDISETNVNVEVSNSHYGEDGRFYTSLPERLDTIDTEINDAIAYTDESVASVANGTPEAFADLTAIQAAYPTGNAYVKLNLADGYVYKWNGSAWVQGWVYQSSSIASDSVYLTKLSTGTQNLIGEYVDIHYTFVSGYYYNSSGVRTASAGYWVTENISCSIGDKFQYKGVTSGTLAYRYVLFDGSGNFLSAHYPGTGSTTPLEMTIEITNPQAKFIAFSVGSSFATLILKKLVNIDVNRKVFTLSAKANTLNLIMLHLIFPVSGAAESLTLKYTASDNANIINRRSRAFTGTATDYVTPIYNDTSGTYSQSYEYTFNNTLGNMYVHVFLDIYPSNLTQVTNFVINNVSLNNYNFSYYRIFRANTTDTITYDSTTNFASKNALSNYVYKGDYSNLPSKLVSIGDSITRGYTENNSVNENLAWTRKLADAKSWSWINKGIDGSTVANVAGKNPMCLRYQVDVNDNNPGRVIVAGGSNDWGNAVTLGSLQNLTDNTQFYAAYYILVKGILDGTKAVVYCSTPILRKPNSGYGPSEISSNGYENSVNSAGYTLEQYRRAIKDIVNYLKITGYESRVFELDTGKGTYEWFKYQPTLFDATGYHPLESGHWVIANYMIARVN